MFTDATRAMAVGSGEKDNKKALAQRKKQVKTIHTDTIHIIHTDTKYVFSKYTKQFTCISFKYSICKFF